jgi:hypothetical protein
MNSKTLVLGERGKIHEIEGDRDMDSLQGWRWMMRLVLAPKSIERIEEKLLISQSQKLGQKYLQKL